METAKFAEMAPLGKARSNLTAVVLDNDVYALGGYSEKGLNTVER